ncbi:MAG: sulfatase-like hydrolase/transferase, partial [bacterium]
VHGSPGEDFKDADRVNQFGREWIKNHAGGSRPFFLYLHYMDPHEPYKPPSTDLERPESASKLSFDTIKKRHLKKDWWPSWERIYPFASKQTPPQHVLEKTIYLYDSEIRYWDREFGRMTTFLSKRNLLKNSLIVVVSDHGEEFFLHGNWAHNHSLFNELIHVPLVIRPPETMNYETGIVTRPVSLVRLRSTILDVLGLGHRSIRSPISLGMNSSEPDTQPIYSSWSQPGKSVHSLIRDGWKIHRFSNKNQVAWRLYHLNSDISEQEDQRHEFPNRFRRMKKLLRDRTRKKHPASLSTVSLNRKLVQNQLEGLGYVE